MQSNKRYVAHFDMLGFKTAVLRNQKEAWGALSDLQACMSKIERMGLIDLSKGETIEDRVKCYIFSDSILMFTLGDSRADLMSILIFASQLFGDSLHACVPLRGGIAFGDFLVDLDLHLFCGVPFVRAYELGERAQWSGIVVDDNIAEHCTKHGDPTTYGGKSTLIKWDVPLKNNNKESQWVINWPLVLKKSWKVKPPISAEEYYQAFEGLFGPYNDLQLDVKAKYENTVDFVNYVLVNSPT